MVIKSISHSCQWLCFNHGGDELDKTDVGKNGKVLQVSAQNPRTVLITEIIVGLILGVKVHN